MSLLWCGGEDISFQNGGLPTVDLSYYRVGYARCDLQCPTSGNAVKGNQFPGGAVTTAWMSWRGENPAGSLNGSTPLGGFGQYSSTNSLVVGTNSVTPNKATLYKYNGSTLTALASETGTSLAQSTLLRFDMQVVSYGASASVNVYVGGSLIISFTGDVTVSGMTAMDCCVFGPATSGSGGRYYFSEVMVADEDLRAWPGLVTLAPNATGATASWTGTWSTVNQTTLSDANPLYTNTAALDEMLKVTSLPSGTFVVKGVQAAARMAVSATGAVPTKVKLGWLNASGATGATGSGFGSGSTKSLTGAYTTYDQLDTLNPVTGVAFTQAEVSGIQIDLESST